MAQVVLEDVCKAFEHTQVLHDITLSIADREFVVLVGPSGCGKSTLLRLVAGLDVASGGDIRFDGASVTDLSPGQRNVAMVFQNYALYPHLSVAANIGFGLRRARLPRAEKRAAVQEVARLLEIEELLARRPAALSGGQRQRVAMGRAIIRKPAVFLFDEPLSNLDARLRMQMRTEIRALHRKLPTTTLYVTHDQTEAMTMGDRVVVLNQGRIEQIGTPAEIYNAPRTRFVAGFIGMPAMNMIPTHLHDDLLVLGSVRLASTPALRRALAERGARDLVLGLRPEHLSLRGDGGGLPARVDQVEPTGSETLVYLHHDTLRLCLRAPPECALRPGAQVHLDLDLDRAVIFDPQSGLALPPIAAPAA
ncbi:MAG: ABC transporter ATP-binding protein [Roseinatronobacter sp.]